MKVDNIAYGSYPIVGHTPHIILTACTYACVCVSHVQHIVVENDLSGEATLLARVLIIHLFS